MLFQIYAAYQKLHFIESFMKWICLSEDFIVHNATRTLGVNVYALMVVESTTFSTCNRFSI